MNLLVKKQICMIRNFLKILKFFLQNFFRGQPVEIRIELERENDENGFAPPVVAPFFPRYPYPAGRVPFYSRNYVPENLEEGWYLVVGDPLNNQLLSIKRFSFLIF